MQIKTLLHSKGFALSPVLKVRVSGTRKWPIHRAKKSVGPVCLTRALNIHIRIRQNTHTNRTIGKIIRFVKQLSLAIRTYKQEKSLLLFRFLRYLGTFRGPSWLLFFLSLEFCYICYFCDICDICHGCFQLAGKILVIFAIFADISGPFLVSFFFFLSKSWFLLFLRFFVSDFLT